MQAIVQLRGDVNLDYGVEDTLDMLNVGRVNHATFVPETDSYRGMITKVNDVVAFGEPSVESVVRTIARRGEPLERSGDIDDEWIDDNTDYSDIEALAEALVDEETTLRKQGLSPTLRLHAPRGGHEGIKHPVIEGGQLGEHTTEEIDGLLEAMR